MALRAGMSLDPRPLTGEKDLQDPGGRLMTALVFDLDGTLIDSAPDIAAALNRVLAAEGAGPLDLAQVIAFIGHGIPTLIARARAHCALPPEREAAMVARMLHEYAHEPNPKTAPYPGVIAALEQLQAAGYRLGLCTNKAIGPTHQILRALDLERFFEVVIGGDSLSVRKPDPAPLLAAFAALGDGPRLYIGDSEVDEQTARQAGIAFGWFTPGYCHVRREALTFAFEFDDFATLPRRAAALLQEAV